MPFWQFYYHLVWSTKYREPMIDDEMSEVLRRIVKAKCKEHEAIPHALGYMPDHVHLAVSIPPKIAVSEFIGQIKGTTTFQINRMHAADHRPHFAWQTEFGALSFGEQSLERVVAYVQNQATHHADNTLWPTFERLDTRPPRSPTTNDP